VQAIYADRIHRSLRQYPKLVVGGLYRPTVSGTTHIAEKELLPPQETKYRITGVMRATNRPYDWDAQTELVT
jgi:hypothetical protein